MAEVFPEPPLIAYRRQKNIKEFLVRAKVPPRNKKTKRTVKGMKKCNKSCHACPFILEGKEIKGDKFDWKITTPANCQTKNVVYVIECNKDIANRDILENLREQLEIDSLITKDM